MKKKHLIIGLSVILMLTLLSSLFSQGRFRGNMNRGPRFEQGLCAMLPDLTEDQEKKIEALRLEFQKQMQPERLKLQKLRLELKEQMIADKVDKGKVDNKLEEISKQELKMEKARVNHRLAVRELLTDEQRLIFDQHTPGGRGICGKRGGRGMRMGRPFGRGMGQGPGMWQPMPE